MFVVLHDLCVYTIFWARIRKKGVIAGLILFSRLQGQGQWYADCLFNLLMPGEDIIERLRGQRWVELGVGYVCPVEAHHWSVCLPSLLFCLAGCVLALFMPHLVIWSIAKGDKRVCWREDIIYSAENVPVWLTALTSISEKLAYWRQQRKRNRDVHPTLIWWEFLLSRGKGQSGLANYGWAHSTVCLLSEIALVHANDFTK